MTADERDGLPAYLLLAPYRSHLEISLYPDSRVIKANCGHHAWLSPQGEAYADNCYTCCMDCGEEVVRDPEAIKSAVPGAMDAVRAKEGQGAVDSARAFMRQYGIEEHGHS